MNFIDDGGILQVHSTGGLAKAEFFLTKQNPSLNDDLRGVYKEERKGFRPAKRWLPNPTLGGLSSLNTDSKNALLSLIRN